MKEVVLSSKNKHNGSFLFKKYVAVVNDEDYELVKNIHWQAKEHGQTVYARGIICKNPIRRAYMHRLILGIIDDKEKVCDHKDGNGLNNTRNNLRVCTFKQNCKNKRPHRSYKNAPLKSKYKGVTFIRGKYLSRIRVDGALIYLGSFDNEKDAAECYNKASLKYFNEFSNLNIIEI